MPSHPRNMPEQEHSIKARSHALFVEEDPVAPAVATKPFEVYLRETPALPLSPGTKAVFWVLGIIVAALFLAALWRISNRHAGRPSADKSPEEVPAKTAMLLDDRGIRVLGHAET
jgi:hypothetical protein